MNEELQEAGLTSASSGPKSSEYFFEFRNISKAFDEHVVLNNVSFKVKRGETCVIMGRSGVGKSVSLKHIMGFLHADSGRIFIDGTDVTDAIRTSDVAQAASRLATIAGVRRVLVAEQQRAGAGGGVVMEGRDIGTVVFPGAELKIFLDASAEVRAERRWKEHQEKGDTMTVLQVLEEVRERDKRDRERRVSPLVRAADAVVVDNTAMDVEETARLIVMLAREREKEFAAARGNA